jgi:hypothetical protein
MRLCLVVTGSVGVAVDEDEAVDHGGPPVGEPDEDVGAEPDRKAHEVRDAEVVTDVLDLDQCYDFGNVFAEKIGEKMADFKLNMQTTVQKKRITALV